MVQFLPLGGAGEIGANCYYLNINDVGIILDCGMHPQKIGLESLPKFDLLENKPTDYVLISHAHQDHLNALPFLIKKFPLLKIITTPQTRAVAELTLHNSISIKRQVDESEFEIYSRDEVDLLIKSINYKSYHEKFILNSLNGAREIEAEFFDAGHIIGSAGIMLKFEEKKIFFTGDINLSSQTILSGSDLTPEIVDILITETTYDATDSSEINTWEKEVERFSSSINKVINNGGSVFIPVFALGKLQEMLATIWLQIQRNKITSVDIYTGGIGNKINRIYDYNRYVVNRNERELMICPFPVEGDETVVNLREFPDGVDAEMGLAGMGDLILTCTGDLSRNRRVGLALASGRPLEAITRELGHVAEGVMTAREVARRADDIGVDMPITQAVCAVLDGKIDARQAVDALMNRDPKAE